MPLPWSCRQHRKHPNWLRFDDFSALGTTPCCFDAIIRVLRGKRFIETRPLQPFPNTHRSSSTGRIDLFTFKEMASEHPDAPKQFGIRISDDVMELVSAIQAARKINNQPITLAAVVEDSIKCHYNRLLKEGAIPNDTTNQPN